MRSSSVGDPQILYKQIFVLTSVVIYFAFSIITVHLIMFRILHGGPGQPYKAVKDAESWSKLLEPPDPVIQRRSTANSQRFGKDLLQWIDNLTSRCVFYYFLNQCTNFLTHLSIMPNTNRDKHLWWKIA